MATPADAVANAAAKFAVIEGSIQKAIDNLNKLPKDFRDVQAGGPLELPEGVKQFGHLEASAFSAEAQVLAGKLADALADVVSFHQACTDRAVELGLDPPTAFGGGGR